MVSTRRLQRRRRVMWPSKDPLNPNRVRGSPLAPRDTTFEERRCSKSK
jgi:hypothetical protein